MARVYGRNVNDVIFHATKYALLALIILSILGPFLYALSVSFRPPAEYMSQSVYWIPKNPTLENWTTSIDRLSQPLKNSFFIATGTTLLSLLIVIPGAYVLGRRNIPGKRGLFYLIVLTMLFPYIILTIPITSMWYELGLFNTIPGMWIAYQIFVAPFAIWILQDFFRKLPTNIEEAAQVYGCSQFSAFLRVILPLSAPGIVAVGFLSFTIGWNDFLFANLLTTGTGPRPAVVTLYISTASGEGTLWGRLMAQTLIIGLPPLVLYMFGRRYITDAFSVN